jgi:TusA-related sulfurtransferase
VLLDHRPAVPDIKRNAEALGHEVVATREPQPGVWEMRLRRG